MSFEESFQKGIFSQNTEKSFIDKVLAKDDVNRTRELIKKPRLKREELLEILYQLSSTESKLLNYGAWDRYIILKFFVWIREFVKIAELLYDYEDDLKIKETTCIICNLHIKQDNDKQTKNLCVCKTKTPKIKLSERTKQLLNNNSRLIEHNAKFLVDLYLNIGRTTLSLGATGMMELLKNKYEVIYPQPQVAGSPAQQQNSLLNMKKT